MSPSKVIAQQVRIRTIQAECWEEARQQEHTAAWATGRFVDRVREEEGYDWRALLLLPLHVSEEQKALVEAQLRAERSTYLPYLQEQDAARLMLYGVLLAFDIPAPLVIRLCRNLEPYFAPVVYRQLCGLLAMAYTAYHVLGNETEAQVLTMLALSPDFLRAYTTWLEEDGRITREEATGVLARFQHYAWAPEER